MVLVLTFGGIFSGYHNYHHHFPFDYKTAENYWSGPNVTTLFIDTCAIFGLAWNLKTASSSMVELALKKNSKVVNEQFDDNLKSD